MSSLPVLTFLQVTRIFLCETLSIHLSQTHKVITGHSSEILGTSEKPLLAALCIDTRDGRTLGCLAGTKGSCMPTPRMSCSARDCEGEPGRTRSIHERCQEEKLPSTRRKSSWFWKQTCQDWCWGSNWPRRYRRDRWGLSVGGAQALTSLWV